MFYSVLVNKETKIKSSYLKKIQLIKTTLVDKTESEVEKTTYEAYRQLKETLKEQEIEVSLDSAYRSLETQQEIYDEFVIKYGKEYAQSIVAPVGASEHHTGLALDLALNINGQVVCDGPTLLKEEATFKKIHSYLQEYGFILRYPKGKEQITGYPYEPWHIRYVGKIPAKIIMENKWTLEEYLTNFMGVLYVNKEKGKTSFDIVNEISHIFGIKKVGHTGTLDPLAEGVLIVALGQATKMVEIITAVDKEYQAEVLLGVTTDTLDITGKELARKPVQDYLPIAEVVASFKKTYLQEVPIYSAVKVNGKKLYEYARSHQEVTLPKKEVTIKKIKLLANTKDTFTFKALVTKGCYIRSLISDIGKSLGTFAIMTSLIRTKQGNISINKTNTLAEIRQGEFTLHSIEKVVDFPTIIVDQDKEQKIKYGQKIENNFKIMDKVIFKNQTGKLLGIYEVDGKLLRVWKNFS